MAHISKISFKTYSVPLHIVYVRLIRIIILGSQKNTINEFLYIMLLYLYICSVCWIILQNIKSYFFYFLK